MIQKFFYDIFLFAYLDMDGQLMSSKMILSSYENQTVIFRCDSGNIHLVHKQFSICMFADQFFLYCRNVRKTLENV